MKISQSGRLLGGFFIALLCMGIAHAQPYTKTQLNAQVGVNFPDNKSHFITPLNARTVSDNIINSIMPNAPVINGDLACFNGTTGLLQDCGLAPGGVTIGETINGGTPNGLLYNNGGLLGNLPATPNSVISTNSGGAPIFATKSGNTTVIATTTGALTPGDCVALDVNGNFVDNGAGCGANSNTPHTQDFLASTNFTPGTTTTLTLSSAPSSTDLLVITFDGISQNKNTWSLSGAVITFSAAIPTNTQVVEAKWSTSSTLAGVASIGQSGTPITGSITVSSSTGMISQSGQNIAFTTGNYTSTQTGGTSRTVQNKLGDVIEGADFGVVCDGSTVTGNAFRAAAAAAQNSHATLHISGQNASGACILNAGASNFGIQITQPFKIACDPGIWLEPDSSFTSSTDVFDIIGGSNYLISNMEIHCNIGNPAAPTRNGRAGIFLDTQVVGNFIAHFNYTGRIQAGTHGSFGLLAINNVTNNPNGGFFLSTIGDHQSVIEGGVDLSGSGDSITLEGNYPYNSASGADNSGVLVDLVANAGGFVAKDLNFSNCGGLVITYVANGEIDGGEYEAQATCTIAPLINISATGGTITAFQIHPHSMTSVGSVTNLLLAIGVNAILPTLHGVSIATSTAYTPVTNNSTTLGCGANFFNVGGAAHVSGTAPANTYLNGC